jgi:hypothetical protein
MKTTTTRSLLKFLKDSGRMDFLEEQAGDECRPLLELVRPFVKHYSAKQYRERVAAAQLIHNHINEIMDLVNQSFPSREEANRVMNIEDMLLSANGDIQQLFFPLLAAPPEPAAAVA